jgi:hypothetical protein
VCCNDFGGRDELKPQSEQTKSVFEIVRNARVTALFINSKNKSILRNPRRTITTSVEEIKEKGVRKPKKSSLIVSVEP